MEFTVDETKRHPHHSGPLVVIPSCIINSDDGSEYGDECVEDIDIEFEIEADNDEAENESAAEDMSKSFEVLVHPMLDNDDVTFNSTEMEHFMWILLFLF